MTRPNKNITNLSEISNKFITDEELRDPPSRLFRQLLHKLNMTPTKWVKLLRNYLDWVITTEDSSLAKVERTTRSGNIKDTYFQKSTLSFSKLIEGLSIVRVKKAKIIIICELEDGEIIEISEDIKLLSKNREQLNLDKE